MNIIKIIGDIIVINKSKAKEIKNQIKTMRTIASQIATNAMSIDPENGASMGSTLYRNANSVKDDCDKMINNIERYWSIILFNYVLNSEVKNF